MIKLGRTLFDYRIKLWSKICTAYLVYSEKEAREFLHKMQYDKMPALEKQRIDLLSNDFDPKNNWWGSMETKD
ncbi:hypothetical protein KO529_10085 [Arenibacter algicola]|uniref:hypothetical protein n=1 Tax=Arenibacter algicola TaxID=616991 RepID=UPI001C078C76|nr:hypothetical protein [Arenibacter algicola]MBU2905133.1 hypothetical protein [Arenibacter algicola]